MGIWSKIGFTFSFKRASETGLLGRVMAGGEIDVSGMMACILLD